MTAKIAGIEIELDGEKKTISVESARALLNALQDVFGAPPTLIPWTPAPVTPFVPYHEPWQITSTRTE